MAEFWHLGIEIENRESRGEFGASCSRLQHHAGHSIAARRGENQFQLTPSFNGNRTIVPHLQLPFSVFIQRFWSHRVLSSNSLREIKKERLDQRRWHWYSFTQLSF